MGLILSSDYPHRAGRARRSDGSARRRAGIGNSRRRGLAGDGAGGYN